MCPCGTQGLRALGTGVFEDATESAGVRAAGWACGACLADFDNDGDADLHASFRLLGITGTESARLFAVRHRERRRVGDMHTGTNELLAGVTGGLGLFVVGMWLLTEHLKTLASRQLRRTASRWTRNRFSALLWGALAGGITQSMSAMTFIVVSILRSGLITTQGALALILGGCVGVSALVVIVSFDIKVVSLYVLGFSGAVLVSGRLSRFRPVAASFLGGAMIILGLALLKDAAAPLAEQPWFRDMLEGTGNSLALAFVVAAFLTFIVQSSSAVSVFGISLATVGVISVDQAIMIMYGSCIGSGAILYLLSASLAGQSRQVAMYLVGYNVLICAVLVPLIYCEIHFDIPLMKASVLAIDLDLDQQLALIYVFLCAFLLPVMLPGLKWSDSVLERLWPTSQVDELSRPQFIHDHASVDVDTSLVLVDLEQRRATRDLSQYFDAVRRGARIGPLRDSTRKLLSDITEFLDDLQTLSSHARCRGPQLHEESSEAPWLAGGGAGSCVRDPGGYRRPSRTRPIPHDHLRECRWRAPCAGRCDGVGRRDVMGSREAAHGRSQRNDARDPNEVPGNETRHCRIVELIHVLLITNSVEEAFFLFSKLEHEFNPNPSAQEHVPQA